MIARTPYIAIAARWAHGAPLNSSGRSVTGAPLAAGRPSSDMPGASPNRGRAALIAFLSVAAVAFEFVSAPAVPAAESAAARASASHRKGGVSAKLDTVLKRLEAVEHENKELRGIVTALKAQVESSGRSVAAAQAAAGEVPKLQGRLSKVETSLKSSISTLEEKQLELPFEVGFRTGWAESPFKLPGGFFYSAYIDHMLVSQEDGVPGGDLTGEIMIGLTQGNSTGLTLDTALLGSQRARAFVNTLELEPTVKYHLNLLKNMKHPGSHHLGWLRGLEPFALIGPSIYVTITETPGLTAGQVPLPPQLLGRRLQNVTEANIHPGFVFGTGFKYSLSAVKIPAIQGVLNRISLGAEWRQNYFANGETFNQYTGSVAFGF